MPCFLIEKPLSAAAAGAPRGAGPCGCHAVGADAESGVTCITSYTTADGSFCICAAPSLDAMRHAADRQRPAARISTVRVLGPYYFK